MAGLCMNEDSNHFFVTRRDREVTASDVDAWVDQYAGTQVKELMLNPNCMRTSYESAVWESAWSGYDPEAGNDQPFLAGLPEAARELRRQWVHRAWQVNRDGIDLYARWIARAREHGMSPWLTMRMNDIHNVDNERDTMHNEFWRQNPQYRRSPYKFDDWADKSFDYGRKEVRDYHFKLIEEMAERYDFDGLEPDWMR
ncbi:MAG: hypothetical protein J7639_17265, partial [Paenibacillaceae bacterium]|nr:hypothetical protein [Paenibacillaceae bacterium]